VKSLAALLAVGPLSAAPLELPRLPGLPSPADLANALGPRIDAVPTIPEPATVLLLGSALLSLALVRKRKK